MNNTKSDPSGRTNEIYYSYKDQVNRYIQSRTNNPYDAEELLSHVFLKIHERIDTYDSEKASLSTWIYAITRNTVNDYLRRKNKEKIVEYENTLADCAENDLPVIEKLIMEEQLEKLGVALEQLPEREHEIILLRFYYERTSKQVAALMGLSAENVRYLQHTAIGRLKSLMAL